MGKTSIEWTENTWNPVRGCSRVSHGCEHCYAEAIAARFNGLDNSVLAQPFTGFAIMSPSGPRWTGRVELIESKLTEPLHWRKPRRVFVNSMSDLFHEALPDEAINRIFAVMALCPQHTFQILTKRARRMADYIPCLLSLVEYYGSTWPLPNVWLGVSVEDQATSDERIPLLLQTPAALRFVSYEPALGPVKLTRHHTWCPEHDYAGGFCTGPCPTRRYLDWIIVGGESGPRARPFDIAWARSIIAQCKAAGVPCFVKQLGGKPYDGSVSPNAPRIALKDRKGGDWSEWPEDLRVREFPKTS